MWRESLVLRAVSALLEANRWMRINVRIGSKNARTPASATFELATQRTAMSAMLRRRRHSAAVTPRVLVVGGGPVGLSMGYLLEKVFNVPTRIIERQTQPTTHPQAHFLNLRTMEVLHTTMPGFHDQLQAQAAPSELWRDYIYCTGVGNAREFARIDQFGPCIPRPNCSSTAPLNALASISPTHFLHFPQNRFEAMLSEFLERNGMDVDRGVELVALDADPAGGGTNVTLRDTKSQQVEEASFDYVIGADGAHSLVRQLCGIEMAGALNLQSIVNVHFTSKALSAAAKENPAMLYFIFNQDVIGVLIAHDLSRDEWVFQIPFFPPQESIDWDFSSEKCHQLIQQVLPLHVGGSRVGADDAQILSVGQWRMSARVAKQYDVQKKIFLVGDAAHQFPPAGGLGMNTGIQDAHNLAWKLALAIQQKDHSASATSATSATQQLHSSTLLRSYEKERQHIAKLNTQLSLRNVERTMKIPNALNVSHNNAKLLAKLVNSAPLRYLPLQMQREFVQNIMKVGKAPLGLLDAASSAIGDHMRRQVKKIVETRSSLGMLFYHFDIGFSYNSSEWGARAKLLMQDPALDKSALFEPSSQPGKRNELVYAPDFQVGMRFPHFWVSREPSHPTESQTRQSTLALVRHVMAQNSDTENAAGNVLYLLVVDGKKAQDMDLSELVGGNSEPLLKHVALVLLDANDDSPAVGSWKSDQSFPFASVTSWRVAPDDSLGRSVSKWDEFVVHHSAALVRPDGHIGFLWDSKSVPHSSASVLDALHRSFNLT